MIREMCIDDSSCVARIHTKAWQVAYQGILDQHILDNIDVQEREEMWKQKLIPNKNRTNFVYETNGEIQGWSAFGTYPDEDFTQELIGIYVHPSHFRQGIGTQLWQETYKRMLTHHPKQIALWVLEKNTQARAFYEKIGFASEGAQRSIEWLGDAIEVCYKKAVSQNLQLTKPRP